MNVSLNGLNRQSGIFLLSNSWPWLKAAREGIRNQGSQFYNG